MPLPLIPLIVAGATATSVAIAGKKGYDSYQNMQETKEIAEDLEKRYEKSFKQFEKIRIQTNEQFESYGKFKVMSFSEDGALKKFANSFQKIKNIEFKNVHSDELLKSKDVDRTLSELEQQVVTAGQILKSGVASIGSGGLAAFGALGAAKSFAAVATSGTKIATLTGIASKNATLAFFGGGALSAGGLGMSGGMVVLGGIALAPALAIGSLIFASSTEKQLEEMYEKKAKIEVNIEELKAGSTVMKKIKNTAKAMQELSEQTAELLLIHIDKMNRVIESSGIDFSKYTEKEKATIYTNYKLAATLKELFDTSILSTDGDLDSNVQNIIELNRKKIETI